MARVSLLSLPLAAPSDGRPGWPLISQRLLPWLLPISLLALWWLASRNQWMSEQILPAPALVWSSALELGHGELWSHLAISLQRLFWGLLAGIAAGALLGVPWASADAWSAWCFPPSAPCRRSPPWPGSRCSWCFSASAKCSSWWC